MAGGPILQAWEAILPLIKDQKIRLALFLLGNVVALFFLYTYLKNLVPELAAGLQ